MKIKMHFSKKFIIILSIFLLFISGSFAKELNIKALEILTFEEGNIIVGNDKAEAKIDDEIEIFADKFTYNKKKEDLIAEGNVIVIDLINKITINSNKINYFKKNGKIISIGKTSFNINEKYRIDSKDVNYYINESILFSKNETNFKDNFNNNVNSSSFKYFHDKEILKGENINLIDQDKNKYFVNKGMFKLKESILIGKDIKIMLKNDTFGIKENEPKLKGNSVIYKNDQTTILKGIFTSCKNNNNCPPWSITSKEIIHDKKKKEINYKNSWLKIYNIPVLYFPKFFHPDPTVKRKSGFLIPTFGGSKNLGASVIVPYFHVISDSEDLTFKPRFFSTNEFLLQTEYRKLTKNSSHIADFSINKSELDNNNGRKTHFFSNSEFILNNSFFDESTLDLKIEKVSNDNYTQQYSLESSSPIIKDTATLENLVKFSGSRDDFYLDLSLESYEKMNKANSDKYEYVYPNYSLTKSVYYENQFLDHLDLTSSGNQKTFKTNVYEAVQINDLILKSNSFMSKSGISSNLKSLIKNVNSNGKNSSKLKDNNQSEILTLFTYDIDLPLIKESLDTKSYLTPKISTRFSPNDTKNLKDETRSLNVDNIFSLNRIGFSETIEGGSSITLGLDYDKKRSDNNNTFLSSKIATVFRDEANTNLPTSSTLGEKQSDFVGDINLIPNDNFKLTYEYSLDKNIEDMNLHKIENTLKINNFVNTFIFYEENNLVGDESYFENKFSYNLNEKNSLTFQTRENKKDNLTEFYKLIYEYKTDCLTASIRYNKEYYSNTSLKPSEELFFNITLIPLGSTQTEDVLSLGD